MTSSYTVDLCRGLPRFLEAVDKNRNHYKPYKPDDFDYYALYLPHLDKVVIHRLVLLDVR
ncbi:hypothetical protein DSM106972_054960 [Dulcicalothrix desertica PCC 7102]|uniref:Uncharacterized protein n=1 Tax=Dulcicalothrix desertica PCC 7102 TaxID=232991 RepID=A0A433VAU4_9CYAN|nr:hypothetical protein DSM106972_054960 [Dulcicalothrix desertica PCC 7102]